MAEKTVDKILKTAQAHVMKNWKTYALILGAYILWTSRDTFLESLGLGKKKPTILEAGNKGGEAAISNTHGSTGIKNEDGTITNKEFVFSQTVQNFSYDIWYWYEGWAITSSTQTERCKIAGKLLTMTDAEIIEQNLHYMKAYQTSIYQSFMGVYSDPCSYWESESVYDKALKKLQNATKNQVSPT